MASKLLSEAEIPRLLSYLTAHPEHIIVQIRNDITRCGQYELLELVQWDSISTALILRSVDIDRLPEVMTALTVTHTMLTDILWRLCDAVHTKAIDYHSFTLGLMACETHPPAPEMPCMGLL